MTRADLILILTLVIFSFIPLARQTSGSRIIISIDGKIERAIDLNSEQEYRIETTEGFNVIQIESGSAYVKETNCLDQICKRSGKISKAGESIACLPHRLLIEVK